MILIVAVDDGNGMMFNHRRQSQDSVLREKILSMTAGKKLWINSYTAKQFKEGERISHLVVDDGFLSKAGADDFCFAEDCLPDVAKVGKLVLFKWNRKYPGDFYFDYDLSSWGLAESEEFAGSSHEKITMEVYVRE